MITFWRVFKSGFRNLFRHAWLSAAATAIMVVALVVVSFFVFSGIFLKRSLVSIKDKIDISIFLVDSATTEQVKDLQAKLTTLDNVKQVTYRTKADILSEYENSPDPQKQAEAAAARVSGGGFSDVLLVKVNDLNDTDSISNLIKTNYKEVVDKTSIDDGNVRKKSVENIGKFSSAAAKIGAVVSITFLIVALLIIFNTIRMAIFTRREEIDIMKLVGATKWFIRGPFIVEGAMYGVLGAILALAIIFPVLAATKHYLASALQSDDVVNFVTDKMTVVIAMEFGLGILIGALSSWLAISRHLKL